MSKTPKIPATDEAWDEGALGREEGFVKVDKSVDDASLDAGLDLQQISIRLQKSLIEDFKMIAAMHGLSYQPLMRQILTRFADSEKKLLLRDIAREQVKKKEAAAHAEAEAHAETESTPNEPREKHRRAA